MKISLSCRYVSVDPCEIRIISMFQGSTPKSCSGCIAILSNKTEFIEDDN